MANGKGNAIVGQSGGPTGVINQSLVGVIQEVMVQQGIGKLLGAVHGVRGIVNEKFADLRTLSAEELEAVAQTPSAALGSTRDKPDQEYCQRIFEVFKKREVHYFFYIGGNDSANTAYIVDELARQAGYELKTYHVPKTIDNDLRVTDHCPGYGSAAAFVVRALMGDNFDNRSLPGVKIDIIMGRDAGFLTAATALARMRPDQGPHLIYVPEAPISMEQFCSDVEAKFKEYGRCLVAVSEGIRDLNGVQWGKQIVKNVEADAHGNIQLSGSGALGDFLAAQVKAIMPKGRIRADTFGYLQRSFAGLVSPVDAAEARQCGREAVKHACKGGDAGSVAMKRVGNRDKYQIEYFLTPLKTVAEHTKSLPKEYINEAGNDIMPSFLDYLRPLVGPLPKVGFIPGTAK